MTFFVEERYDNGFICVHNNTRYQVFTTCESHGAMTHVRAWLGGHPYESNSWDSTSPIPDDAMRLIACELHSAFGIILEGVV